MRLTDSINEIENDLIENFKLVESLRTDIESKNRVIARRTFLLLFLAGIVLYLLSQHIETINLFILVLEKDFLSNLGAGFIGAAFTFWAIEHNFQRFQSQNEFISRHLNTLERVFRLQERINHNLASLVQLSERIKRFIAYSQNKHLVHQLEIQKIIIELQKEVISCNGNIEISLREILSLYHELHNLCIAKNAYKFAEDLEQGISVTQKNLSITTTLNLDNEKFLNELTQQQIYLITTINSSEL